MLHKNIYEGDRCIFHRVHEGIDLCNQLLIQYLKHHTYDKTPYGRDQGHFHTTCNNLRRDITGSFNRVAAFSTASNKDR